MQLTRQNCLLVAVALIGCAAPAVAVERVTLRDGNNQRTVVGRLLVKAADGGLLVEARDGRLWAVTPDKLVEHESDDTPFQPFTKDEIARLLLAEMPPGFKIHTTAHYVICYNSSREYAVWCASLLERLHFAFTNYWKKRKFELSDPEFPLVALAFADRASYRRYAQAIVGDRADSIIGYYNLESNRVIMYDLTASSRSARSTAQINQLLGSPEAERTVATIIHEATHQVAFNTGLQTRYSDVPLWISEGIAIYFETPDLKSRKGWRTIGAVNRVRLARFKSYLRRRPARSLETLISDDKRFRSAKDAEDAYAEAWALNFFLIRQYSDEYLKYMQLLSEKPRMIWDNPEARLRQFQEAFGTDLRSLDAEFVKAIRRLR